MLGNLLKINVLLIEDNLLEAKVLQALLTAVAPSEVVIERAEGLSDGLSILSAGRTDLVLLDLSLPDSKELASFVKIHELAPSIPIIILTGLDNEMLALEAVQRGAQDYLIKGSVDGESLVRSMRYAIERRRAEELAALSLKIENETISRIIEFSPAPIIRMTNEGVITEANLSFGQMVNLKPVQVIGADIATFFPGLSFDAIKQACSGGRSVHLESDKKNSSPEDDTVSYRSLTVWPIKLPNARTELVLIAEDITDRVTRLQQRDQIIAMLAHDLKLPVLASDKLIDMLLQKPFSTLTERDWQLLCLVREANREELSLIQNMVYMYKLDDGAKTLLLEDTDLLALITTQLSECAALAESRTLLVKTDLPQSLVASVDKLAMKRVLANLVHNAIKFTDCGGLIEISGSANGERVVLKVANSGQGIPVQDYLCLFRPFWQAERHRTLGHGSGLGLYVCKQIIHAHNGEITCESDSVKGGTTFTITVPIVQPSTNYPDRGALCR